jgi:autotransporter translocation and assembly factor TamB
MRLTILLSVVGIVVVSVLIAPRLPFVRSAIQSEVVERANAVLDGKVEIGELEVLSWTTLLARDVVVWDKRGNVVARVDRVSGRWSLASLASQSVVVDDVTLEGAEVAVRRYADGSLNVAQIAAPSKDDSPPPAWMVIVEAASLGGDVVYWDDTVAGDPPATLPQLEAGFARDVAQAVSADRDGFGALAAEELSIQAAATIDLVGPLAVDVSRLELKVSADAVRDALSLSANDLSFRQVADGRMAVDLGILDFDGRGSLGDVSMQMRPGGEGIDSASAVIGAVSLKPSLLDALPLPGDAPGLAQPLSGSIRAALEDGRADATAYLATEKGGRIEVGARFDDIDAVQESAWRLSLDADGIVADRWSAILAPLERGTFTLWAEGTGTTVDLAQGRAGLAVRDATVDRYRLDEAFAGLSWDDGELVVEALRVRSPYAKADGRGAVSAGGRVVVELDLESRDALADALPAELGLSADSRGFVELDANVQLDFEAEGAKMVRDGRLAAKWDIAEFGAEDISIAASRGDVELVVDQELGDGARRFIGRVDVSGRSISARGYRVSRFDIDADAASNLRAPYGDVSDFVGRLDSALKLQVSGLRGPGTNVQKLNVAASTNPVGSRQFTYDLDVDADTIRAGGTSIGAAQSRLKGKVSVGAGVRLRDVLQYVVVRGGASVSELESGAATVRTAALELDVGGPTQNLTGRVELAARGAVAGDYDFESLVAILKLTGDRKFTIDADAKQATGTPETIAATILGHYSRDLKSYTIDDIRFDSGGQAWTFSDGFSFSPSTGRYTFDDVTVSNDGQTIRLDGYFAQGRDQDMTAKVDRLSIRDLRKTLGVEATEDEPSVRGEVSLDARLWGTSRRPQARFDIWVRDLYVDEQGPFDFHLVGTYVEDRLQVDTMEAFAFDQPVLLGSAGVPFRGTLEGEGEVLWDEPFSLDARVPKLDVATFGDNLPIVNQVGAAGTFEAEVAFQGRLREPRVDVKIRGRGLKVDGELDDKPLSLGPYDLNASTEYRSGRSGGAGALEFAGMLEEQGRAMPLVDLSADVEVDAPRWLEDVIEGSDVDWRNRLLGLPYDTSLAVNGFDLRTVGFATLIEADAEGIVFLEAKGEGTLGEPKLDVTASLDDFGWDRYRDVVFDVVARVGSDAIELQKLRLEWDAEEIFRGTGKVPLPVRTIVGAEDLSDLPLQLELQFARIALAKLQAVDYTFASVRGTIGGYVKIDGRLSEPAVTSRFSLVDTQFADRTMGTVAVELGAGSNRVDLLAQICRGPDPVVDLRASVPLNLDIPAVANGADVLLDGPVSGRLVANRVNLANLVPARILDKVIDEVGGQMSADVRLAGTTTEPRVLGDLRVADASVFITPYGRRFDRMDLDVSFRPDGIRLKEAQLRDGRGLLEATGKLGMVSFKPDDLRLRVRTEELNTGGFTPFPMFVNSDVDTRGVFEEGLFDGSIDITGLEVKIPETADASALPTEMSPDIVFAADRNNGDGSGFLSLDDLDEQTQRTGKPYARFSVEIANDSWVRHPVGDVNVTGSLDVELAGAGATVGGEVEALRGDFELLGKRFEVRRGVVSFTGANPPNPRLDVEAVYLLDRSLTDSIGQPTSGQPRVIVSVVGTPDKPDLKLSSDPQMPEDDIIYVLVTNRPPQSSGVGEREGVANTALSAASGIFAGILQQKLQESIPVDVLRVETGDDGFTDYRVEAGKYLTDTLFLSLQYQFGAEQDENTTSISVEYRFAPRWTFEVEAGDRANGEANIFWDVY